ncbi:MAG: hypothetical protein AAF849_16205 [Bacteroidota bacterium]
MRKIQIVILLVIVSIAISQGIGLKILIPMMQTGLSSIEILILSGISAALFLPFVLEMTINGKLWHFLPIALIIGSISGFISGYFLDCLLSNVLIGLLSVLCIYLSTFAKIKLIYQPVLCFLLLAILSLGMNIFGHRLSGYDAVFYIELGVVTIKDYLICGGLCAWMTSKLNLNNDRILGLN